MKHDAQPLLTSDAPATLLDPLDIYPGASKHKPWFGLVALNTGLTRDRPRGAVEQCVRRSIIPCAFEHPFAHQSPRYSDPPDNARIIALAASTLDRFPIPQWAIALSCCYLHI